MSAAAIVIRQTRRRGRQYDVALGTGETLRLPAETVLKYGLFAEAEFAPERWLAILQEAWQISAYERLLGLLARRARTETEVRTRLARRGFDADTVAHAMGRAKAAHLLDDAAFARLFIEERLTLGAQGRPRIALELRRRGVAQTVIAEAFAAVVAQHGAEVEFEQALTAARRKWSGLGRREPDPHRARHKLLAFLAARGYAPDLCYRVVAAVTGAPDEA